ncbi:hypothetical protein RhiXN_11726 [Rhizoctonia solani]|uniref:Uncharacterized protein n=1 Tax=Rhizoctonia solani TaxID=456999 RepID=A0A8H8P3F9_9AGAM|nr:uncharacterized protein RhiXN_11726 [Rhizoctonia solani]QRW24814.1 hypothetical protein RhiXN_11726 [Rhizoctonia solani]
MMIRLEQARRHQPLLLLGEPAAPNIRSSSSTPTSAFTFWSLVLRPDLNRPSPSVTPTPLAKSRRPSDFPNATVVHVYTIAQIFAAAQHQQAQQQANLFQQLQAQQATSSNSTTQLLANIQQQQQAQSNQMMSMLQQYQQSATNFNPYQNAQQNQQMLDLLSQTQSGGAPPVDWASLANASGMDPNMLMSMMMGGMDPTNIAIQGASFMFG